MKRLLPIILLLALLLSACTGPQAGTSSTVTQSTTGTQSMTPAGDPEPENRCEGHDTDPYVNVDKEAFYASYEPACCYTDACYRTEHFLMSGYLQVPDQDVTLSSYQPMTEDGRLIRNTDQFYEDDGNTYVVVDAYGTEVYRIYKGAAYITLAEVAAYMYAFGGSNESLPANYVSKKVTKVGTSPWGEYLRGNHSYFSGNTDKYPYEPELPDISGCGGDLQYFELDIGTTGTDTGNGYPVKIYNDGSSITRGAARLVYARQDKNGDGIYSQDEVYVFYTCNHYNDFREYLNYDGGWGEIFGNETGGGTLSSKSDCNPTPYVTTGYASFAQLYGKE